MPQLSMNIGSQGVEQDRTVDVQGFDNVAQYTRSNSNSEPTVPFERPKMVMDASIESSDTMKPQLGQSASDITARTRNG